MKVFEWSGYTFGGHPTLVLLTAGLMVILGIAVLVRERDSRVSIFFFILSSAVTAWLGSYALMHASPDPTRAERWARAACLGIPIIPAASYMFTIELLGLHDSRSPVAAALWGFGGLGSLGVVGSGWVIIGMHDYPWGYYPKYDIIGGTLLMVFMAVGMGMVVYEWWEAYRRAESEPRRMQAWWFLVAFSLGPLIFFDFLATFSVAVYPFGYVVVAAGQVLMAVAMLRYDLVELTPAYAAENIIGTMADPMVVCDESGRIEVTNEAVEEVFGVPGEMLEGETFERLAEERGEAAQKLADDPTAPLRDEEMSFETADGEVVVSVSRNPIEDQNGEPIGAVVIARDISRRKRIEAQLQHDSLHDSLTDVPNRALFVDRVEQHIKRQDAEGGEPFSVVFLDLDRFKTVNESLGHATGDELLRRVADRIQQCLRRSDTLARIGGDEFGLLLDGVGTEMKARSMATRIRDKLEKAFLPGEQKLYVSASIGVVVNQGQYDSPTALLRDADRAMYRAKRDKLNQIAVFEGGVESVLDGEAHLESALRRAIEQGELTLNYQPLVDLDDERPLGVEALARWHHPDFGEVPPDEFIPLAEETGMVFELGQWVLREACEQMAHWRSAGDLPDDFTMNVNLSAPEISSPELVPILEEILEETGLPGHHLQVEITERILIASPDEIEEMFDRLSAMDIRICIDDFGTGYSSLSYLRRFQADALKIDIEFVRDVHRNRDAREIVGTIRSLADKLDLEVVAEGIEKRQQLTALRDLGVDIGQGYLWAKPKPADEIGGVLDGSEMEADASGAIPVVE